MRDARSGCAINVAVEVLGDPWTLVVLRDIVFGNRRHFRELLNQNIEGIASNVLASRLKSLVEYGLLTRDDAGRGQRATYSLTEAGIQTVPVMVALGAWGLNHCPTEPSLAVQAKVLATGSPALVEDLMDELRELHLGAPARRHDGGPRTSDLLAEAVARCPRDGVQAGQDADHETGHPDSSAGNAPA